MYTGGSIIYINHHTRGTFKGIKIGSDTKSPLIKIADMSTVNHRGVELTLEQVEVSLVVCERSYYCKIK